MNQPRTDWTNTGSPICPRCGYPGTAGGPSERIVRHPNGHLVVERTPPWVPSQAETDAALASLAKAWPVLAQHAQHIDGEFDLALTDLRRMVAALAAVAGAAPADPNAAGILLAELWNRGWRGLTEADAQAIVKAMGFGGAAPAGGPTREADFRLALEQIADGSVRKAAEYAKAVLDCPIGAAPASPDELRTVASQVLARLDAWLISEDAKRGMTKEMTVLSYIAMDLRKALKA